MSGKGKPKKTQEQFEKEVYDLYQEEYTVLGKYINANEYIKMRHNCDECNSHEYDVKPTQFLKGKYKCPICFRTSKKKTINMVMNTKLLENTLEATNIFK